MSELIINLTKIAIAQEVEDILDDYPTDTYRQALHAPDLRQALIAYVLNRIPNCYMTAYECQFFSKTLSSLNTLQQGKAHRAAMIRQGIEALCQQDCTAAGSNYYSP